VICRLMLHERVRTDQITHGVSRAIHVTAADEPRVLGAFCCGTAIPRTREDEEPRAHHTFCPIWEAHVLAREEGRERIAVPKERPTVTPFGIGEAAEGVRDPREAMEVTRETVRDVLEMPEGP